MFGYYENSNKFSLTAGGLCDTIYIHAIVYEMIHKAWSSIEKVPFCF